MRRSAMTDSAISRRIFLAGAGTAVAGSAVAADEPRVRRRSADSKAGDLAQLDTPSGMLEAYVRVSGDSSGEPYCGAYSGHLFAVQPNALVEPLCGFTGFGVGWDRRQSDGSYQHAWKEVGFYTDLVSGEILERWKNPLNGELCEVMHIHNRSVNMVLAATPPKLPPPTSPMKIGYANFRQLDNPEHPYGLPYAVLDDQVSLFSDGRGYVPNPLDPAKWVRESAGPMLSVAEFNMMTSSLREALDPAVANAKCTGSWTRIGPWLPWMLLGPRPGHLFYRSATRKLRGVGQLSAQVRAYADKHYPEFLEAPKDFRLPMESSWEVFKSERTPHS